MKAFEVKGQFLMSKKMQPFTKQVAAETENNVREYIFSVLGSEHRISRRSIEIASITEITEGITDSKVRFHMQK